MRFFAHDGGISIPDLFEQAMIRECDFREDAKRVLISDLIKTQQSVFKTEINKILDKKGS